MALSTHHNGFPVVADLEKDGVARLTGLILRKHLMQWKQQQLATGGTTEVRHAMLWRVVLL